METCPHYLSLSSESVPDGDTTFKCTPPIRSQANQKKLWSALEAGVIDFIASDHSPCSPDLKLADEGDFENAWGGISSLQLSLPVIWDKIKDKKDGLFNLWTWLSHNPAKFLGLDHCKGDLKPGMDADIMIWNPDKSIEVREQFLHFRHKMSPYMNRFLAGKTELTILGGNIAYKNDQFLSGPVANPLFRNLKT